MLAIRLQRNGRAHLSVYRIIVQEAQRHPLSGRVVAELGSYDPHAKKTTLNKEKAQTYLNNGAQPSTRAIRILKEQGIKLPKWVKSTPVKTQKAKNPEKLRKNQPKEPTPAPAEEPIVAATEETPATIEEPTTTEPTTAESAEA